MILLVAAPALAICLALLGLETLEANLHGWLLLLGGVAYPLGAVIHYFARHELFWRSTGGPVGREEKGDRSFWLSLPGFLAVTFIPPVEWLTLPPILPRGAGMQITGSILVLAAVALSIWARFHIRGLYSGHVQVHASQPLVQSGPYRFIRHPSYSSYRLIGLGLAVGNSSWIGLAAAVLLLLPGLAFRMTVEERLLGEQFGEEYKSSARRTKKLLPGIW